MTMKKFMGKHIFSRLSNNARISIRNASIIAENLKSKNIEPEHMLIGILLNDNSLATKTVGLMGFNIDDLLTKALGDSHIDVTAYEDSPREVEFSSKSRDILRKAFNWSQKYSHVYVGSEHLMLAILESSDIFVKDLVFQGLDVKNFQKHLSDFATYPLGVLAKPDMSGTNQDQSGLLEMIGQDLVDLAREGKLDSLVGREEELNSMIKILSRRKKNNPIIVGDAGVGKTVLVEGLAQKIADGKVPPSLRDMKIVLLDVASIMAGSKMRGDVEEKVIEIVNEVVESTNTILFIDEIHTILTTGIPGGSSEIASILKPALLRDDFRCIGATTTDEYSAYFETDNAMARRFQPIFLKEASLIDTIAILKNLRPVLEAHHSIQISDEALTLSATLSDRYVSDRYLPDKAIDLLDEASATKRLSFEGSYEELSTIISKVRNIQSAKEEYILKGQMESAVKIKKEEESLKRKVRVLELQREEEKKKRESVVNEDDVRKVVSDWTGIPLNTLGVKEKSALLKLEGKLKKLVVGQNEAVSAVVSSIKRARTGISDADRPWASFLFLGPTGVGKTELGKVLARELFGNDDRLIQIDMSEMMEMHSVSKLIGSPPGYIGFQEGGRLTESVRRSPHSVILFDEIEKAHPDVLNILLQILEYGHLTDGRGRKVNFKNTIVILTSNIGAEEISRDKVLGFSRSETTGRKSKSSEQAYSSMKSELLTELRRTLRPELLNRLDDIVIFRALSNKDVRNIVSILVSELNERLIEQGIQIELTKQLTTYLAKEGFSEEYGARPLRRVLQDQIESVIADYLLTSESRCKLELDIQKGKITVKEIN
jgi:ATP-dependent Clp protease ATP-binding subunit ClpC